MEALREIYNKIMEKPLKVLEIFNDFFGEDKVDLQGFPTWDDVERNHCDTERKVRNYMNEHCTGFILVHFPHVTVTNEHNRSTEINHLYAKVVFDLEGKIHGRFALNRSEYSLLHITNGYMHSHVSSIPLNCFTQFQVPCTGTGPINNTICSLSHDFDEGLWRLFCLELDKYVQVESLAGVPYHRLEGLVSGGRTYWTDLVPFIPAVNYWGYINCSSQLNKVHVAQFTKHIIDEELFSFHFVNDSYKVAMSPVELAIKVSNSFIDWYNKGLRKGDFSLTLNDLLSKRILHKCKFTDGKLMYKTGSRNSSDYSMYIGQLVCTFKGKDVRITIPDLTNTNVVEENEIIILEPTIIGYILTKITNVINFKYGREHSQESATRQKVHFL